MTQDLPEIANAAPCSDLDEESLGDTIAHDSTVAAGLFQRQLVVAGLCEVAEKVAAGSRLEFDDALRLSGANLPLLGRIVQLCPDVGWASKPVDCEQMGSEGYPTLPAERLAAKTSSIREIGQPLSDWDAFCRALLAMRGEVQMSGEPVSWYPAVTRPPDEDGAADDNFTGVDVLRAIALARLVLPPNVRIVAPLATLGPKLAQVALDFGASHMGYVAADGQQPDDPLVADLLVLDDLQRSCSPTQLKEEEA